MTTRRSARLAEHSNALVLVIYRQIDVPGLQMCTLPFSSWQSDVAWFIEYAQTKNLARLNDEDMAQLGTNLEEAPGFQACLPCIQALDTRYVFVFP